MKRVLCMLLIASCSRSLPPDPQVLLYVDTDAIVAGSADPLVLSPQVDRVRFDLVVGSTPVPGGARVFDITDETLRSQRLSIGVLPQGTVLPQVRVRFYRADRAATEDPPVGATLEVLVDLAQVPLGDEVTEAFTFVSADSFGKPIAAAAVLGKPPASRVGTWHGGRHVGCAAPAAPNEACVPSSSFFFGDPAFRGRTFGNDIYEERLVWVSPFYVDTHEVTVADFRAAHVAGVEAPTTRVEGDLGTDAGFCTFTKDPGPNEALPLTCISWNGARAYCQGMGKDLPSEAQYELIASGLGAELAYPWGNDEVPCGGAVWGRGGDGLFVEGSTACRAGFASGPSVPGSGSRDKVDVSSRGGAGPEIVDLGGNVSEWMLDGWSTSDGFWKELVPMFDPVVPSTFPAPAAEVRPTRGGTFPFTVLTTRAAFRLQKEATQKPSEVGFRCARRAQPASAP